MIMFVSVLCRMKDDILIVDLVQAVTKIFNIKGLGDCRVLLDSAGLQLGLFSILDTFSGRRHLSQKCVLGLCMHLIILIRYKD